MDDEQIEVVEHFKYVGSLKSADGNCRNDIQSRIGMAKKGMLYVGEDGSHLDLALRRIRVDSVTKADEKRIESA